MNDDFYNAYPCALAELAELLKELPGVGKRSAERMMLNFFKWDNVKREELGALLVNLQNRVGTCPECGNFSDRSEDGESVMPCPICASPVRDRSIICVVEEPSQIRTLEASGMYRGMYHVLGGRIAPLEGRGVESITASELGARLEAGTFSEMILALSPDIEGQATAVYLADIFKDLPLKISVLARGLPAGSDLSYADPATVAAALEGRKNFN